MIARCFLFCALIAGVAVSAAEAQVTQRPSRPSPGLFGGGRPPDANAASHELTLTASVLAGFGDFLTPQGSFDALDPAQRGNALMGSADASLRYAFDRPSRSFTTDGRLFSNAYADSGIDPTLGGSVNVGASTDVGRKSRLTVGQNVSYEPSLVLGAFAPLLGDVDPQLLPESGERTGVTEQRSLASTSSAMFERRWSTRQTAVAGVSYTRHTYLDDVGYDSSGLAGDARYTRSLTRTSSVNVSYRYSETSLTESVDSEVPVTEHIVESGFVYTRRLSPTRQVRISAGAGGTYVQTFAITTRDPLEYWMPSGSAGVRMDVGRSWAIAADYRRAASVLQGITLQTFATDVASLRADGRIGSRLQAAVSAAFSNGDAGGGVEGGRFESYSGTAQLRYALTRWCATTVSYDYYSYRLREIVALPVGLPGDYDRQSVRFGLTFWLPLYGSFSAPAEGRAAR